jgi:beta-glucosidase/6-phospho-beta-glucosidase/beta-galactosidase
MTQPFLWGVAISAYQSEGGYNRPGEPQTNWAKAEAAGVVDPLGDASQFLSHYEEDLRRCRDLGLNAFRMSIEWSRVQPTHTNAQSEPPPFDQDALRQYAGVLTACRDLGIEPIVTLHHFVHPAWLGSDPWLTTDVQRLFEVYVREVVLTMNRFLVSLGHDPIRYFITINEPNMLVMSTYLGDQFPTEAPRGLASAIRAFTGLITTHVQTYNLLHDLYRDEGWGQVKATINNYTSDIYGLDRLWTDLLMLREWDVPRSEARALLQNKATAFNQALVGFDSRHMGWASRILGSLIRCFAEWVGQRGMASKTFDELLDVIYASPRKVIQDYVAYDYYDPFCAHSIRFPSLQELLKPGKQPFEGLRNSLFSKWWDWRVLPEGLRFFSQSMAQAYPGKALLIAENGMAHRCDRDNRLAPRADGMRRSAFIRMHAGEVVALVQEGVPLIGYFYWSLFDNYEWGTYSARFGLFSLDYEKNTERRPEDHFGDRPSETYAEIVRSARLAPMGR